MAHTPTRTCISCRTKNDKNELIRIVKNKGQIFIDWAKTSDGRGCYVCNKLECVQSLYKKKALSRAFKTNVSEDTYKNILEEFLARQH